MTCIFTWNVTLWLEFSDSTGANQLDSFSVGVISAPIALT